MANIIYDLVDPVELTDYVRQFSNEMLQNAFGLQKILPNRLVDDLEFRVRKGGLTDVDVAEFRAWDTQPALTGRPGITRVRGEIAPVSRQIALLEEESLRLRSLQRGTNNPIINAIFDDSERMTRAVEGRIELARGDVLVDGIVTIAENGLQLTADYGMPATHKVNAAVAWTAANAATALPITNLLAWLETYNTDTGEMPMGLLMARKRLAGLAVNAEVRAYASSGGTTPSRVDMATIQGIFSDQGIPPIMGLGTDPQGGPFYDTKVRVNGVSTRVIPDDKVIFVPPNTEPVGETFYGLTAEAVRLIERKLMRSEGGPGIVSLVLQNDNPVQTFTLATAVALPVVPNADLLFTADVE